MQALAIGRNLASRARSSCSLSSGTRAGRETPTWRRPSRSSGSNLGPRAAHALFQAGYTQVANLQSGIEGWRRAGLPVNPA